ncbi:hypothetical protein [Phaeovulum vinaykumarii]|uniref:Methionyl-tRNA formyltransferase n=1 Tax=Phaeovulum vinaykumarii TaxID=407234 RepID=A0A1N7LMM6_9RHOB|nr:hypothetical protein [Phaeovulum vinaykumarii]SIS75067.1 hypothetical protein SAMN05421795_103256 [Phaeovulum vinaykumarii]SOC05486.1 hypothetical protein SAMN05878426_103256 [Phaeovulum vinaykumarii]
MALVVSLEKDEGRELRAAHPTRVPCKYIVGECDGRKVLQLNTYGSGERAHPGKLSQTLQFDEDAASQLFRMLKSEFGFEE